MKNVVWAIVIAVLCGLGYTVATIDQFKPFRKAVAAFFKPFMSALPVLPSYTGYVLGGFALLMVVVYMTTTRSRS